MTAAMSVLRVIISRLPSRIAERSTWYRSGLSYTTAGFRRRRAARPPNCRLTAPAPDRLMQSATPTGCSHADMKAAPFAYSRPETLDEACALLAADDGARL